MDPMGFTYTSVIQTSSIGLDVTTALLNLWFSSPLQCGNGDKYTKRFSLLSHLLKCLNETRYYMEIISDLGIIGFYLHSDWF